MATLTLVLRDDVTPFCDECGKDWPTDLPTAYAWDGCDVETGQPLIKLFCSSICRDRWRGKKSNLRDSS